MSGIRRQYNRLTIYTDGSCDNAKLGSRPGAREGGFGVVITKDGENVFNELSIGTYTHTTSARMEILAIVTTLELLPPQYNLTIWSDNQYAVNAYRKQWVYNWRKQGWVNRKNADLWKRFIIASDKFLNAGCSLDICWVKGHAGHPLNERADELANLGRENRDNLIRDIEE